MGTSIECFFPRAVARCPTTIQQALEALFAEMDEDLTIISTHGQFSAWRGEWWVKGDEPGNGEPDQVLGEGPCGFTIEVYPQVIELGSLERFERLYDHRLGIARPLRRVLAAAAHRLGASDIMAVRLAGVAMMGNTDVASGLAYYHGASFGEVCDCMASEQGPPAQSWEELALQGIGWYLGPARDHP